MLRIPEVFGITVSVIYGHTRETGCFDTVDDRIVVAFLHQDMIDPENEMRSEGCRDAVEVMILFQIIMIFTFVERACVLGIVQRIDPCAFNDLEGLLDDLGICTCRIFLFAQPVFEFQTEILHLFFRLVTRPSQSDGLLEVLPVIRQEIDRAFLMLDQVLGCVGAVPAFQQQRVVILAGYIERCQKRIRSECRLPFIRQCTDEYDRHREKQ